MNDKVMRKDVKNLADELKAKNGKVGLTNQQRDACSRNIDAKLTGKVADLTVGTKIERTRILTRDINLSKGSKNPVIMKLHLALVAELARIQ